MDSDNDSDNDCSTVTATMVHSRAIQSDYHRPISPPQWPSSDKVPLERQHPGIQRHLSLGRKPIIAWDDYMELVAEKVEQMQESNPPNTFHPDPDHKCQMFYYAYLHAENAWDSKQRCSDLEQQNHELNSTVTGLETENAELKKEVAKLKKENSKLYGDYSWFVGHVHKAHKKLSDEQSAAVNIVTYELLHALASTVPHHHRIHTSHFPPPRRADPPHHNGYGQFPAKSRIPTLHQIWALRQLPFQIFSSNSVD